MPTSWRKNFTQIDNVNNGNEFELNDYPLLDGFNVPLNNTQWLYDEIQKNEKVISGTLNSNNVLTITNYNSLASANRDKLKNWKILITKDVSGVQDCLSVFNFVEMQLTNNGEYNSIQYVFQNEFDERITIGYEESDNSYSSSYEQTRLRLYRHAIILNINTTSSVYDVYLTIVSQKSTPYSLNDWGEFAPQINSFVSCSGGQVYNGTTYFVYAIYAGSSLVRIMSSRGQTEMYVSSVTSLTDNVKEITS